MKPARVTRVFFGLLFAVGGIAAGSLPVVALSSPNYSIDEDFVGGGGTVNSSSPSFSARDSIGAPVAGDSESTNNKTQSGATTDGDPMLEFSVNSSSVALGSLLPSLTRTATSTFSVRNYTSHGYVVQVVGSPPSNGSHSLTNMATAAASAPGTEQFGINLVANTSPSAFGANPVQVPTSGYSFGVAASGYNTANNYRYNSGDVVASAPKSSGQTDYTVSYIANSSTKTPAGSYSGTQTFICTGTY